METFGDMLTRADHKARMDRRFYDDDPDAGMRMAHAARRQRSADRQGAQGRRGQILQRRRAARGGAGRRAQRCRLHLPQGAVAAPRRQADRGRAAAAVGAAQRLAAAQSRRMVGRAPPGRAQAARSRTSTRPPITWRATRCRRRRKICAPSTNSPPAGSRCASSTIRSAAAQHFARVGHGTTNPITLARGEYWQGRALEAAGRNGEARAHYQAAAQYPTAYYGQIARARLGLGELALRRPPESGHRAALMNLEVVRAVQLLYAGRRARSRHLVRQPISPTSAVDTGALVVIAEIAQQVRRRARDAADRQGRAQPRLRVRRLRLPDQRHSGIPHGRARTSTRASCSRSRGRKARSIRARCRAPMRSA